MTPYLLDTHALLWLLLDPGQIPSATLKVLRNPKTQLVVSAASACEIATKHRLGRLPAASAVVEGYTSHLQVLGVDELPISTKDALTAGRMSWAHRDPFDRMLVAQAILRSMTLVTKDSAITDFNGVLTRW